MMVYAYVHRITEFGENEPSVQKSVFKRLRVEHCSLYDLCYSPREWVRCNFSKGVAIQSRHHREDHQQDHELV